jgi:hypothetical protein
MRSTKLAGFVACLVICAPLGAVSGAATASAAPTPVAHAAGVPNVRCYRLDRAKDRLRAAGYNVRVRGGGLFGIQVESNWVVVTQSTSGRTVTVYVDRSC